MDADALAPNMSCPVCLAVFTQPKVLPCGHCFCQPCVGRLIQANTPHVRCPVCQAVRAVPADGFPTNYALAAVVEQVTSAAAAPTYKCVTGSGNFSPDELYVCTTCAHSVYCSHCAIAQHNGHQLTKLTAAMEEHNDEKAAWAAARVEQLVGSRERVHECQLDIEWRLQRLYDLINEHFAQKTDQLVRNGEMIMALLNAPGKPTSTGAFPPFALYVNGLQRRIDAHDARVTHYMEQALDVLRPVAALEAMFVQPETPAEPPVAVALPCAGRLLLQQVPPRRPTSMPASRR